MKLGNWMDRPRMTLWHNDGGEVDSNSKGEAKQPPNASLSNNDGGNNIGEEVDDGGNDVGGNVGWPKNTSLSNNNGSWDEAGELCRQPKNYSLADNDGGKVDSNSYGEAVWPPNASLSNKDGGNNIGE